MKKITYTLAELSRHLSAELKGDPECVIHSLASLEKAQTGQITFLGNSSYRKFLETTSASAVVIKSEDALHCHTNMLIVKDPSLAFAKLAELFVAPQEVSPGIHPSATIGRNCQIAASASIGAQCVIGDNVFIGEKTVLHPGTIVGNHVTLGEHCILWSHVTIYYAVKIANRVIIHSGAVVGSDGFGLVNDNGVWKKVPQIGGVEIGNDVEIGANTTIDRGAIDNTIIEDGVKLDNLIQIAHNVRIGAHTAIAACTVIAGSTTIGKYCMIAGAVSINGHIEIADGVIVSATASVISSIKEPGVYSSGIPAHPHQEWRKNTVRFLQLDDIARRIRKLEKNTHDS